MEGEGNDGVFCKFIPRKKIDLKPPTTTDDNPGTIDLEYANYLVIGRSRRDCGYDPETCPHLAGRYRIPTCTLRSSLGSVLCGEINRKR